MDVGVLASECAMNVMCCAVNIVVGGVTNIALQEQKADI